MTNSSSCGCEWIDGVNHCDVHLAPDGSALVWVPSFPNFDSTGNALLALFQVSSLDGWASLLHFACDYAGIDVQPARESTYLVPTLFFLAFIIFGVLFAANVFVGVVIDEFQSIKRIYDGSASLTEEQVKWVNTQRLMLRLRPEKQITSEPPSEQPYRRLCFRLTHDEDTLGRPANAPDEARYFGKAFDRVVAVCICLNVIALTLWSDPISPAVRTTYEVLNYAFVLIFALEAAVRIGALTFKGYIKSGWNRFDFALVAFSIVATSAVLIGSAILGVDLAQQQGTRWLRCARALRIVRLSQVSPSLLKLMRTMLFAAPSICNITVGIFLFTFAYAQFGMTSLGTLIYDHEGGGFSRHANFETALRAFSSLVRMSTGDSWSAMLADAVHNPHVARVEPPPIAVVYFFFLFYVGFMGWVLVSIFVAIMLDYFNDSNYEDGISVKYDDIESFQRKWLEFDVQATSYMRTVDLGLLLYACKPPLVGVHLERPGGDNHSFFNREVRLVRPNLRQLESLLVELDVPDHDGSVHFLEVLLALLQRLTGVVHEEQIMAKLLTLHPKYVQSIKRMPGITGSTADEFVKGSVMDHLKRGLAATGLLDELEHRNEGHSFGLASASFAKRSSSFMRRRSLAAGPSSPWP